MAPEASWMSRGMCISPSTPPILGLQSEGPSMVGSNIKGKYHSLHFTTHEGRVHSRLCVRFVLIVSAIKPDEEFEKAVI